MSADWISKLNATPCKPTVARWSAWQADASTFCVTFDSLFPKRNAEEWRLNWREEYGKPQLRPPDGSDRTVTEFEIVKAFRAAGWEAVWKDTFGAAPPWMKPWTRGSAPPALDSWLERIRGVEVRAKPWDVLAWRRTDFMFVEAKAGTEKFTQSEQAFLWGAHELGIPLTAFAVVRASINYRPRD